MTTETFHKPIRQTIFVADLKCYLCGGVTGSLESDRPLTPAPPVPHAVLLHQPGGKQPVPVLDWRRLRCDRCNGPLYLDEPDVIVRRIDDYNWLDERPRRGRPPKRLVEERRRQRALETEAQAA